MLIHLIIVGIYASPDNWHTWSYVL